MITKKTLYSLFLIIMIISSVLLALHFNYFSFLSQTPSVQDKNPNSTGSSSLPNQSESLFSFTEIYYHGDYEHEFLEFMLTRNMTSSLVGVSLRVWNTTFMLPDVHAVSYQTYFLVYTNLGVNDLDPSDELIVIHLNLTSELLMDVGEAFLFTNTSMLDYVRWGNTASTTFTKGYWPDNDYGPVARPGESLQLFGNTCWSSSNWLSSTPTPGARSALSFTARTGQDVIIENGQSLFTSNESWLVLPRDHAPVTYQNDTSYPVNASTTLKVQEMVNFTLGFYAEKGFPAPRLSSSGKIIITLRNKTATGSTERSSTGATGPGHVSLEIPVRYDKVDLKVTVEHELFHLIQFHLGNDTSGSFVNVPRPYSSNLWWIEGMAEYWGVQSAMKNYNLTMTEVRQHNKAVDTPNWWKYGRDLNTSIFKKWGGSWDDYETAFEFIKYLMETYGLKVIQKIQNNMKHYPSNSTHDVTARKALENALNKTLDNVLMKFYEWRVFDRQNGTMPPVKVHVNATITSPPMINGSIPVSEYNATEHVNPGGALVEAFTLNGTRMVEISFTVPNNGNMSIIIMLHNKDGTTTPVYINNYNAYKGFMPLPVNPNTTRSITIIKIKHLNATETWFNITVMDSPGYGIKLPFILPEHSAFTTTLPSVSDTGSYFIAYEYYTPAVLNLTLIITTLDPGGEAYFNVYNQEHTLLYSSRNDFKGQNVHYWIYEHDPGQTGMTWFIIELAYQGEGQVIIDFIPIQIA